METDGRHAVVAFSDRLEEDARRRDLTFNALYADRQGRVEDPVGTGIADLAAGLVRFVGDPGERIREDYLRILRYFRFLAWFGDPKAGPDADTLAAISNNLASLDTLAAERTGHEMRRLLGAPDPLPALGAMAQIGALALVLPGADITAVGPLVHLEAETGIAPDWLRRLIALGGADAQDRLRLSKHEAQTVDRTREAVGSTMGDAALGYRLGEDAARSVALIRAALSANPLPPGTLNAIQSGAEATFPVAAKDLMPAFEGPALGAQLRALEDRWIASGFTLDRQALLGD